MLDLRGNVNTRLAKLDAGEYGAIVLACAGLDRLGFGQRIRVRLAAPDWLPAPAQGAIALECRTEDLELQSVLMALDHVPTRVCVEAERAMNRALHGSCHVPVAAQAELRGGQIWLSGLVGSASDGRIVTASTHGPVDAPELLGQDLARELLRLGAGEFL